MDYSLYLVTDRGLSRGRSTLEIVRGAVRGGITCVQLREKSCSTREFIAEALAIKAFLNEQQVPLFINDRIDVALAVKADGVHLGQTDMPFETARELVGDRLQIGISAESLADAVNADQAGAAYVSVSPIFDTPTKTDTAPALGLSGLREICQTVSCPVIGIGGLNAGNIGNAIRCGASGVAVVSAIVAADDPEAAAHTLKEIIVNELKRAR